MILPHFCSPSTEATALAKTWKARRPGPARCLRPPPARLAAQS